MIAFAVILLGFILGPILFPGGYRPPPTALCLSHLKQIAMAELMYQSESDDRFSDKDQWMDLLHPYVRGEQVFHCTVVARGAYGYAFNSALSGAKTPSKATEVPMVYDSSNLARDASDRVTSLPTGGRHRQSGEPKNVIFYADGHGKAVKAR